MRNPPAFARTLCAVDYAFPWDRLISKFKFHAQVELADVLSQRMVDVVAMSLADDSVTAPRWVIPVPLSPQRLAERGFNQAWELARRVASALSLRADAQMLARVIETPHQADLTRAERLRNLRAAFVVDARHAHALQGQRVALVDDVMTTGATADESARALLRAGASAVDLWVLARTPAP